MGPEREIKNRRFDFMRKIFNTDLHGFKERRKKLMVGISMGPERDTENNGCMVLWSNSFLERFMSQSKVTKCASMLARWEERTQWRRFYEGRRWEWRAFQTCKCGLDIFDEKRTIKLI